VADDRPKGLRANKGKHGLKKYVAKDGTVSYRIYWHRKGQRKCATFPTQRECWDWKAELDAAFRNKGRPPAYITLAGFNIKHACEYYLENVINPKIYFVIGNTCVRRRNQEESWYNAEITLEKFMEDRICEKSLSEWNEDGRVLIDDYKNRRKEEVELSTIRREFNLLQRVFAVAQNKYKGLENHFKGYKIPGSMRRRKGRPETDYPNFLMRLLEACEGCLGLNKIYAQLAILVAVETGMRMDEIFNLDWSDLEANWDCTGEQACNHQRRIYVRKSKTDKINNKPEEEDSRKIVMPLETWCNITNHYSDIDKVGFVFPRTEKGNNPKFVFKRRVYPGIVKRAGLKGLQFRDLRREAAARFWEAGLDESQREIMLGHASESMTDSYVDDDLKLTAIQEKLDRHFRDPRPRLSTHDAYGEIAKLAARLDEVMKESAL
jgi:integrase